MIRNLREIVSNNYIGNIIVECSNKTCIRSLEIIQYNLAICKNCDKLICYQCTNKKLNKCVLCLRGFESYDMCWECGNIIIDNFHIGKILRRTSKISIGMKVFCRLKCFKKYDSEILKTI